MSRKNRMPGLRQKGGYWYIEKRCKHAANGWLRESTGCTSRSEAEAILIRRLAELEEEAKRRDQAIFTFEDGALRHIEEVAALPSADDIALHCDQLLPFIGRRVRRVVRRDDTVADLFCGTGAVSRHLKRHGVRVLANDQLAWCAEFARAGLVQRSPRFTRLVEATPALCRRAASKGSRTWYALVLEHLDGLRPREGFMYSNYSPASAAVRL